MKYFIIILFITIGFCNNAFTQNENGFYKNEWSVNINFFVNEIFLSKNIDENIIDYEASVESLVTYRRFINEKFAWQIGGTFYKKNSVEDFIIGFGGDQSQKKLGYYLRTGFQKFHHLSQKVKFYFGTDLLISYQKYKGIIDWSESPPPFGFEENYSHIDKVKEIGLVPHIGFRWHANEQISFSMETSLVATMSYFELDLNSPFSVQPILRRTNSLQQDSENFNVKIQQPFVLLLNLKF